MARDMACCGMVATLGGPALTSRRNAGFASTHSKIASAATVKPRSQPGTTYNQFPGTEIGISVLSS